MVLKKILGVCMAVAGHILVSGDSGDHAITKELSLWMLVRLISIKARPSISNPR